MSDPVSTLSRAELRDIRFSLEWVQSSGDSVASLRAMRLLTLLDQVDDHAAYVASVEPLISAAEDLRESCENAAGALEEACSLEFDPIEELLIDNPNATPSDLVDLFKAYAEKQEAQIKAAVAAALEVLTVDVENHAGALEALDPTPAE